MGAAVERPPGSEAQPIAKQKVPGRPVVKRPAAASPEKVPVAERRATTGVGDERPAARGADVKPVVSPRSIEPVIAEATPAQRDSSGGGGLFRGWVAAGALGLIALFGIVIYIVTNGAGTVKIVGAGRSAEADD